MLPFPALSYTLRVGQASATIFVARFAPIFSEVQTIQFEGLPSISYNMEFAYLVGDVTEWLRTIIAKLATGSCWARS